MRAARQRGAVFLELAAYLLVIVPEPVTIARGGVDHVNQHPGPLHVAQKLQPEPGAGMRALDQPRQVSHRKAGLVGQLDHAQHRFQRRERIIRDLRAGGARRSEQRRLAGVRQPDEPHVRDQFELEPQPARLTRLSELREARGLAGRRLEAGVAPPTASPPGDHQPLLVADQVGDRLAVLVDDQRARRNLQHQVGGVFPMAAAATTAPTAPGGEMMLVAVILQGVELAGDFEHHVASPAAVTAIGTATRHVLLTPEAERAGTAISGLGENLDAVGEHQPRFPGSITRVGIA